MKIFFLFSTVSFQELPKTWFQGCPYPMLQPPQTSCQLSLTFKTGPVPDIALFHSLLDNVKNFCDNEMELIVNDMTSDMAAPLTKALNCSLSYIHLINVYTFIYTPVIFKIKNIFSFSRLEDCVYKYTWKHIESGQSS